jgi:hypothetical protein
VVEDQFRGARLHFRHAHSLAGVGRSEIERKVSQVVPDESQVNDCFAYNLIGLIAERHTEDIIQRVNPWLP